MRKIKLSLPYLTAVLIFAAGCQKHDTPPPPPPQQFQLLYKFVNDGDNDLKSIVVGNATFYPKQVVDDSSLYYFFSPITDIGADQFRSYLIKDRKATVGCYAGCKVVVNLLKPQWSPLYAAKGYAGGNYPNGWTDHRIWQMPITAIHAASDTVITFRYPSDTSRCREVLFLVE